MISVRRADLDDLEVMVAVYTAAWREGFKHMFSAAVFARDDFDAERRTECLDTVLRDDADTFVALHGERVVGLSVSRRANRIVELDDIWVHPSSWGTGAAAALVARIEDDLRAQGGQQMVAWVPEDSPRGRRFFDKIGWKPTGDIDVLTVYPSDHNRMIEYSREPRTIDYTRGLPRPNLPAGLLR